MGKKGNDDKPQWRRIDTHIQPPGYRGGFSVFSGAAGIRMTVMLPPDSDGCSDAYHVAAPGLDELDAAKLDDGILRDLVWRLAERREAEQVMRDAAGLAELAAGLEDLFLRLRMAVRERVKNRSL